MTKLPAPYALKKLILQTCIGFDDSLVLPELNTEEEIDNFYHQDPPNDFEDYIQDAEGEVRGGEVVTGVEEEYSRHYEAKSVAAKIGDDWVGWTYWYGGGKHGCPEEMEWIDDAYYLTCEEKEVLTIQRTWTKVEQ